MSDLLKSQLAVVGLVTVKANEQQNEGNLSQIIQEISENNSDPEFHQLCLAAFTS